MPINWKNYLVFGVSSRALFNLETENEIFETLGVEAYSKYQIENENNILFPGVAFPLVKAILHLNSQISGKRKAAVVLMSRNNPDISLRISNSIREFGLDIPRATYTSGASLAPYLNAFKVDLFLSANEQDVQQAVDAGFAAARVCKVTHDYQANIDQIRIAFDADAVVFSDESEEIYKEKGLEAFLMHEKENALKPLPEGPFAKLLKTLSYIQSETSPDASPIRTALVTARNSPADERVIRTLRAWKVRIDEAFFMGGLDKTQVLAAFNPHIFFDDQDIHLSRAEQYVPSAKVPYRKKL